MGTSGRNVMLKLLQQDVAHTIHFFNALLWW